MSTLAFLRTLLHRYRGMVILILGAGALSGVFSAAIVAVINALLHPHDHPLGLLAAAFVGLVAGKIAANLLSQLWLVRFAQDAIIEVTVALCKKLLKSSLRTIERAGPDQILTTLTDDVGSVVWAAQCFPNLAMNSAMIAGCGFYLLWLSPAAFFGVVGVTVMGAAGYYWLHRRSLQAIAASREAKARTFSHFRELTSGIQELLVNAEKGRRFLEDDVRRTIATLRDCNLSALRHQLIGESWTQALYYLLVGLLLVVFPAALHMSPESLTGFVFAMLFLMNPVWGVMGALPIVARGHIAIARLHHLGLSLDTAHASMVSNAQDQTPLASPRGVYFDEVMFRYDAAAGEEPGFSLGPVNFTLQLGELVFIVGGNGSGKSTFVKVLTGLYAPDSGAVRIDETPVTEDNRGWYRQHFSVVFSNYHLFETMHGFQGVEVEKTVNRYLQLMEIDKHVTFAHGRFSTVNLSQGQRRRLALITAYLEDRPIYVFDEWAADQDPHYKSVFYNKLLPELCERGKAVVVITHDDRYFHLGDRVVKLEEGAIVDSWNPRPDRAMPLGS